MPERPDGSSAAYWLSICCGMVFFMVLLGGITRLTGSGLSITTWEPITGLVPPLDDAAWRRAFEAYQGTPQYQELNRGMPLSEFKTIFFWEWLHRLWGRLIGIVFAVPLAVLLVRGRIGRTLALRLGMILALGGLQGGIGWFMVQSGLEDATSVSPYRLALHLVVALVIYSVLLWTALDVRGGSRKVASTRLGWVALALLGLTISWGALVAGLRAGLIHNTWPLMDGDLFPDSATLLRPLWLNPFENPVAAQFIHRWLGPLTLLAVLAWVWRCRRVGGAGLAALALAALAQVGLGLATLLSHVEIIIAVVHQAGAMILLTLLLYNLWRLCGRPTGRR